MSIDCFGEILLLLVILAIAGFMAFVSVTEGEPLPVKSSYLTNHK